MKFGAVLSVLFFSIIFTLGQGTVVFNNLASTNYNLYTNNPSGTGPGLMSGANRYRIGLYASTNLSATAEALSLVGLATNIFLAGKFNGGNPFVLPPGYPPGQPILFQLRVWTLTAGTSYEAAVAAAASDPLSVTLGCSPLGIVTAGNNFIAAPLFGTNELQLSSGFVVGVGCPTGSLPVQSIQVPHGVSTIANPYSSGRRTISQLMPNVPEGTQLYKIDRTANTARWTINQFQLGAWLRPDDTIEHGHGAFIRNPGTPFTVTFYGHGFPPSRPIYPGVNLIGLPNGINFSPLNGDLLGLWNGSDYEYYQYISEVWYDSDFNIVTPSMGPAESVLYQRNLSGPALARAIFFHNYVPAASLDKPVKINQLGCTGTNLVAQLQVSYSGGAFQDVGPAAPLLSDGYLDASTNLLRELQPNAFANQVRVRVWDGRLPTYAAAGSASALVGASPAFNLGPLPDGYPPLNMPNFIGTVGPVSPFHEGPFPYETNQTVLAGDTAGFTFTFPIGSFFGYTFQWQRAFATSAPPALVWNNIPGATSGVYHIPEVQLEDAAYYRVFMTYHCTNRASHSVYLNVIPFNFSQSAVRGPGNLLTFDIQSQAGLNYRLFSSVDLETWTPGPIYSNRPAQWSLSLTNGAGAREFFRLGVVP